MIENIMMAWSSLMLNNKLHGDDKILWQFLKNQLIKGLDAPDLALVIRDGDDEETIYFYTIDQLKKLDEEEVNFIMECSARYKAKRDGLSC